MRETADQQPFLLATLPPSPGQNRLAVGIVVALIVVFGVTAPFINTQLPRVDAFIPTLEGICIVNDLITSALLFSQFTITRRLALMVLSSGFLFSALIIIPHALSFPGAFTPTGLLGAKLQSTAWLYNFWKLGLPMTVILYALLKTDSSTDRSPRGVIFAGVAITFVIVCGLTWLATAGEEFLPRLMSDGSRVSANRTQFILLMSSAIMVSTSAAALALLWTRRSCVLDLWLMVVCCAMVLELAMNNLINARFSVGWYASRVYSFTASIIVLLVLLSETTTLYANLALSVVRQRGAREARQIAMEAMAASIAHEINQPLGAMVNNASASLRWLTNTSPNFDEALLALKRVVNDGHRATGVVKSLRTMFKKEVHGRVSFGINDLVREVLTSLDVDLRAQQVSVSTQLSEDVPRLLGDRGQLQQVLLNLIINAIEAMGDVTDRARVLQVSTNVIQESSGIMITVNDSGNGIEGKDKDDIFEPFFTKKTGGTGIGLAVCRSIVEAHGGTLAAFSNKPYGTIFRVALPDGGL